MSKLENEIIGAQEVATEREAVETLKQLNNSGEEAKAAEKMVEDAKAAAEERKAKRKRVMATIESVFTGDILLAKEATRVYNFLLLLGAIFLASIFTMFSAFQQELECSKLQAEVTLLREERTQSLSARINSSSPDAIRRLVKERGLDLVDSTTTPTILE